MIADLIHHVRDKLDLSQIAKCIAFFIRIMNDPNTLITIQTMSAKLLVHLVECIFKLNDQNAGRVLLINLLYAFVNKIKSLSKLDKKFKEKEKLKNDKKQQDQEKKRKREDSESSIEKPDFTFDSQPLEIDHKNIKCIVFS